MCNNCEERKTNGKGNKQLDSAVYLDWPETIQTITKSRHLFSLQSESIDNYITQKENKNSSHECPKKLKIKQR